MPRTDTVQFNVRSAFVRERATQIARETGMSATKVIEEALRAYAPPPPLAADDGAVPPGMIRKSGMLVLTGGPRVTLEQLNAMIEESRNWGGSIRDADEE